MKGFGYPRAAAPARRGLLMAVLSGALLSSGCGASASSDWVERLRVCPNPSELGRFEAWDKLEIRVFGEEQMSGEYTISPQGSINFPMLGELSLAGLRCDEVERLIAGRLAESYLRSPSVVCVNKDLQRTAVTVDGQVRKPGVFDFRPGLMLTDVIAQSEGLTVRAQDTVVITRKLPDGATDAVIVPYDDIVSAQAPNVCLHPGDLVYVPESTF
ncbi:MAG: polysaccharide biosynthesis/export family protein [Myxococcota bacterium]|jgi:polysaccharide export outer membrane protein|nr:polysaccharide biosynthesis/export family protein [Myxococcota bacterium]